MQLQPDVEEGYLATGTSFQHIIERDSQIYQKYLLNPEVEFANLLRPGKIATFSKDFSVKKLYQSW